MTQSGQGEEPSARPAREGIVLPSDGGAPLHPSELPPAPLPPGASAPTWNQGGHDARNQPPAGSWGGAPEWGDQSARSGGLPLPPEGPSQAAYGSEGPRGAYGPEGAAGGYGSEESGGGYRADGSQPGYGTGGSSQTGYGAEGSQAGYGTEGSAQGAYGSDGARAGYGAQGASQAGYGADGPAQAAYGAQGGPQGVYGAPGAAQGPYAGDGYAGGGSGMPLPPVAGEVSLASGGAPMPPAPPVDEGATQYLPPVPSAGPLPGDEAATQYIPPVPAAPEAATQFLPPVGPGALPPEASADATAYLGRVPDHGAGPLPPTANPDAEPTQFIPPVPAQPQAPAPERPQAYGAQQQPDVFDSLFRSEPAGAGPAGATQQMPRIEQPYGAQPPQGPGGPRGHGGPGGPGGHGGHPGRATARRDGGGSGGGRTRSKVPLIAAVGIGIAVLGIGAGALMASGGKDDQGQGDDKAVTASEPSAEESSAEAADPAKEQAVALDKLLADSGNSRNSVIKAVANIRSCTNLGQAATDLRNAAKQRNDLVTKLGELSVDKLPDNAALTTSLTKAWQASASADNHYAAWADQVAGKRKLCKRGQARSTGETQAGNQASSTASAEKTKAAQLWNGIAGKYGLTQRQAGQL
ncbi:hypothetical protein [Streptomyces neyagawaensis]|uniref:hypothetical protein n=1 Tax=Streptomyces neyagawaensis TaxID=42238 RepID=UPI00201CB126|nr:hypothetical protein [Streptomyces neyagawaensis]MCL6737013.1 hypothetical protein [Streptomyces neyagawaensis]MDE1687089.1 hypothetical protein [Streptomyces neyagawaensis]